LQAAIVQTVIIAASSVPTGTVNSLCGLDAKSSAQRATQDEIAHYRTSSRTCGERREATRGSATLGHIAGTDGPAMMIG